MKLLTTKQVILRIIVIISLVELLVTFIMGAIPYEVSIFSEGVLDVAALAVLSTPLIYIWVIKPFVVARDHALGVISELAYIDPLTKLANRRLLSKHLERALASSARHELYGALLLLDLDEFKPINDALGHDAGDAVLVEIAKRLQSVSRSEDVVSRLGGDEFVVLVERLDVDERIARGKAVRIAQNLINQVDKPFDFNGKKLQVGASIGIRLLGSEALDVGTAIREADAAMYRAKKTGKGCAVFFEK
jgi:two-component system cell cycle response regulator